MINISKGCYKNTCLKRSPIDIFVLKAIKCGNGLFLKSLISSEKAMKLLSLNKLCCARTNDKLGLCNVGNYRINFCFLQFFTAKFISCSHLKTIYNHTHTHTHTHTHWVSHHFETK